MKKSLVAGLFLSPLVCLFMVSLFAGAVMADVAITIHHRTDALDSSPNFGDIDGDGDLEIIVPTTQSHYFKAYHHDGSVVDGWGTGAYVPYHTWFQNAMYDIDGDGKMELISGEHKCQNWQHDGGNVYIYKGDCTSWNGWPKNILNTGGTSNVVVADLDRNGKPELIFTLGAHNTCQVIHIDNAGNFLSSEDVFDVGGGLNSTSWNSVNIAVGDIDNNGSLEIVSLNGIWNGDGTQVCSAPYPTVRMGPGCNGVVIGDLNKSGKMETVTRRGSTIYVWDCEGKMLSGWPKVLHHTGIARLGTNPDPVAVTYGDMQKGAEPVIGDLDGDGNLEVIVCSTDRSRLYAFHHDGSAVAGWPAGGKVFNLKEATGGDPDYWETSIPGYGTTPHNGGNMVMGDIDGDGDQEIVYLISGGHGSWYFTAESETDKSTLYAFHHDGTPVSGFPKVINEPKSGRYHNVKAGASPMLADLDEDGDIEIVVQTREHITIFDLPGAYDPDNIEWGRWRHDERNTACYEARNIPEPSSAFLMILGLMGLFSLRFLQKH